ncbi:MAG: iron ABC transporter permease [Candidatus Planktophila sp.]
MRKLALLLLFLLTFATISLIWGAAEISNPWSYVLNPFLDMQSAAHQIIWDIRAPRVAAAILVGASLGVAGVMAQGSTNNPIADPAILGTSAGAALGVLIAVIFNLVDIGSVGAVIFATFGALLATLLTFSLARSALQLITIGIGVSAILTAIVGLAITILARPDARSITFWSLGSMALVTSDGLWIMLPVLLVTSAIAWKMAPLLDLLSLGDASVRHIGHNPQQIRLRAFVVLSTLVAVSVSIVGSIAFLALAAPHIARYINGPRTRSLLIYAATIGALILLIADTAARALFPPNELPIGLLTSLIGAPILIATLKRGGQVWR